VKKYFTGIAVFLDLYFVGVVLPKMQLLAFEQHSSADHFMKKFVWKIIVDIKILFCYSYQFKFIKIRLYK